MEIDLSKIKLTKLFARLLKQRRAYFSYIRTMKKYGHSEIRNIFVKYGFENNFLEKTNLVKKYGNNYCIFREAIDRSFYWDETENGDYFWNDIYDQFSSLNINRYGKVNYEEFTKLKN